MGSSPPVKPRKSSSAGLGLRSRLVLVSWTSLLIALVVGGGFASYLLMRNEEASWRARLGETGQSIAQEVADFILHTQEDLRTLDALGEPALKADPELAGLVLDQHDALLEVVYLESDGALIAEAFHDQSILAAQSDLLASPWFTTAHDGTSYLGNPELSLAQEPYLVMAEPGEGGRVIAARVRISALWRIVSRVELMAGEAFVMDNAGRVIAHPDVSLSPNDARAGDDPATLSLSQVAQATFLPECQDLHNRTSLCNGTPIPGTEWVVVTSMPQADAFRASVGTLAAIGGALLLIGAVAAVLTWWRLKVLIFQPVETLQRGAEALGRGELDHQIPVYRRDDIGRVAESMNAMAARLQEQRSTIERHALQLESLYQLSLSLTKRLEVESVLDAVMSAAFELLPGLMDAHIFLYADDQLTLAASHRSRPVVAAAATEPRRHGSTYKVARTGEMILLPDVRRDPNYPGDPKGWPGALACVPLKVGLRVVGVLNAAYEEPHTFEPEDTRLLLLLADQVAIAIENARLYGMAQQELLERRRAEQALQKANEDLERKVADRTHALVEVNQRLETLQEIDRSILAARSMVDIADAGLSRLRALVGCEQASLILFDPGRGEGRILTAEGAHVLGFEAGAVIALEDYGPIDDLQAGEARRIDDLSTLPNLTPMRQKVLEAGIKSFLTVPLVADSELIGEVNLASQRRSAFNMDTEQLVREVGNQLAVALHQAMLRGALEAEQQRLGRLVENLPQGVALLGGDKRVILANALARDYLPELGRWPTTATLQHIGGHPLERMLVTASQPGWHEVRLEAGLRKVFEVAALRLGEGDETAGWIVQVRDVTSERSAQVQQRSQERLAAVGQLAAGLAHDFNNIISVILLYAELLLQSPTRSAQDVERLRTITQQGQRAAQLIQQILDFSRQTVMEQHPFDLVPFMREMEGLLMRTLPETIRVRVVTEDESLMLNGDPARIRQVCINLALNAREAMPDGGDLRFTLSDLMLQEGDTPPTPDMGPGAWVRMSVADTGTGIKPEVMPHIFEPFFTTKSPAHASGLGLSQVYGIVQQHHGHIGVTSPLNGGTTFNVYFPAHSVPVVETTPAEEPDVVRGNGETVLVVEDNDATRASVCEILKALGYQVLEASDGQQALAVYARDAERIDLVLSDLVMPVMGGSDLVRALQATAPEQRFLLMTGYPLGNTRELLESGQVQWMQKPLSRTKLARAVRKALGPESAETTAP
ncbi:MAG: GAF domain-containing protein [Chloroflexi bacterium]|nr:GAF domain-containing protein [Chloroflexota bacterium]